jgi:hypothetical protein
MEQPFFASMSTFSSGIAHAIAGSRLGASLPVVAAAAAGPQVLGRVGAALGEWSDVIHLISAAC